MSDGELALVGRREERKALEDLLRDSGLGFPRASVIVGEPGIGKTRVLTAFASIARQRGFEVVAARAQPGTRSVPAGTLLSVLPAAPPAGDEASLLWWVRNTLLGSESKQVLLVDDAHLADDLTLAVCGATADSGRVPVVLAARSTEEHPDGLAHIQQIPGVKNLRLDHLDLEETRELVVQVEGAGVEADSARKVYDLTDGVPLAVRELVRAARDSGSPLSSPGWSWDPAIAADPGLASLFAGRLRHTSEEARRVLWLMVAADSAVPERVVVGAVSRAAVEETLERGLLSESDGTLVWSHSLLGQLAAENVSAAVLDDARVSLTTQLGLADPEDLVALRLAARLDLDSRVPRHDLQVRAAGLALGDGHDAQALSHARAAMASAPDDHRACLAAASAAIRLGRPESHTLIGRALDSSPGDDDVLAAATRIALLIFGTSGDADAAIDVVALARPRVTTARMRSRLEYIKMAVNIVALPPEEFLAAATQFLDSDDTHPQDRAGVEGFVSIMLAALGEIERASRCAAALRSRVVDAQLSEDQEAGFYGGAMAALFGGDAHEASRLVREGSEVPPPQELREGEVGRRSMAATMDQARGHCHVGMPDFVKPADEVASLRYAVLTRIYSVWELALRRDPRADELWEEVQRAPAHLRAGPGFLEAFAGVALLASKGDTGRAAASALALADAMGPARSAAAWLLHDAARHGRASDAVAGLESIAQSQDGRYLPAMFEDSARAMLSGDPAQLAMSAADFRKGGFDLFSAELDILAWKQHRKDRNRSLATECAARARGDLERAGGPWTPIVGELVTSSGLTDRQREICRLVVLGRTNAQVADELGISVRTVENQLHRVYGTTGVDRARLSEIDL